MAEETNEDTGQDAKGFSPIIKKLLIVAVTLVIPASLALVAFQFVVKPLLSETTEEEIDPNLLIPMEVVAVEFLDKQVALESGPSGDGSYILMYSVTLMCDSQETSDIVNARKQYFDAKIDELHRAKSTADIADTMVVANIETQILIEANKILKRINPEGANQILEVMHSKLLAVPL
jgi:flagellar basal body-associated protein FliL